VSDEYTIAELGRMISEIRDQLRILRQEVGTATARLMPRDLCDERTSATQQQIAEIDARISRLRRALAWSATTLLSVVTAATGILALLVTR
jgi:DNA-binding transcriptional MerR regulator